MKFFTLIHICKEEQSLHNNSLTKNFDEQISLYLTCAKNLHRSLVSEGIELIILTNDQPFLQRLNKDGYPIQIIPLQFSFEVPTGIKFYSAHFKLEVFTYLSALHEEYIALVDSDILCINPMPETFENCVSQKLPLYYDITDQVTPAYGASAIIKDKERISEKPSIGLWAGGEFIAGPPSFFGKLSAEINSIKSKYLQHYKTFHHQGDEMLTSVAIENIKTNGDVPLLDAGALSIVGRYWSYVPLHIQKPIEAYTDYFLLHLPSDKKFIITLQPGELKGAVFFKKYSRHIFVSRTVEKIFKRIKPYAKRIRKKFAF